MKKIDSGSSSLSVIVTFLFISGLSLSSAGNDRTKMNLSGKVKNVITFEFETKKKAEQVIKGKQINVTPEDYNYSAFDSLGKLTGQASFAKENALIRRKTFAYDGKDSLIEILVFTPDTQLLEKVTYTRDLNHRATEIRYTDGKEKLKKKYLQNFDTKKLTMEWTAYNERDTFDKWIPTPREIYFYNQAWKVKQVDHYTFKNPTTMIFATRSKYSYDQASRLKQVIHYFKNDSIREKINYTYSPKGKLQTVKDEEYYYSRALKQRVISKYDEKENLSEKTITIPDVKKNEKWTYKYENDAIGNWTIQTVFLNASPTKIVERKVEYYPQ